MAARLVAFGGTASRIDATLRGSTRIGAAAENDLCIGGAGVAPFHARVVPEGGGYSVEPAGQASLMLNGDLIARARLRHLDVISLGSAANLVMSLLGSQRISKADIQRLKRLMDEKESKSTRNKGEAQ